MSFGNERALFTILQFLYPLFGEEIQQEIKGFLIRNEQSDPRTAENAQGGRVTHRDLRGPGGESMEIQQEIKEILEMARRGLKMRFRQ